ncbi:hypothetical protein LCGC14_0349700 [marine sediment metagenome]|uniref:Uncharacterized protein n=1 Tax=marine sediment metagenome TaxID=412755 RepID=A0A0F9WJ28_9ZZZZ
MGGFLKIGVDLYAESSHKSLFESYKLEGENPPVFNKQGQRAMFTHFIAIDPALSRKGLVSLLKEIFDITTTESLDSLLSNPNASSNQRKAGRILSTKNSYGKKLSRFTDNRLVEVAANLRFIGLEVQVGTSE